MELEDKVQKIIYEALANLNEELSDESKIALSYDTLLFGGESTIDSLSLVSVIIDVESGASAEFERQIALTDDRAMSRDPSPFTSVRTLADYVVELLRE